jgi:hypothetical protein
MQGWFIRVAILVATTAIARGVVAAFGLDTKIARLIAVVIKTANVQATAWILSGIVGIICVLFWIALDIPERITAAIYGQRPALGSLTFVNLIAEIGKHQASGRVSARLSVEITNTNDFMVKYRAMVTTEVNGSPGSVSNFEGLIPAHQNRYLIAAEVSNVAAAAPNQHFVSGWLDYDVTYFAAPSGQATRRTARRVEFFTDQGRQNNPPGTELRVPVIARLSNEIVE